jgi:hypothetical protein
MKQPIWVKADTTSTDLKDTKLGAYYFEKWAVIRKLCKFRFKFIPAKENLSL